MTSFPKKDIFSVLSCSHRLNSRRELAAPPKVGATSTASTYGSLGCRVFTNWPTSPLNAVPLVVETNATRGPKVWGSVDFLCGLSSYCAYLDHPRCAKWMGKSAIKQPFRAAKPPIGLCCFSPLGLQNHPYSTSL